MTAGNTGRTVAIALADVARWRADEEARQKAEMVEVEQEIKNLQAAIQNLQNQLDALHKFGAELQGKKEALRGQEMQRAHESVLGALREQARRIGERERIVGQAAKARESSLRERLATPDIAKLVEDYRKFKETEDQIAKLPESYRGVLLAHHESVVTKLRTTVREATGGPVTVDAEPVAADLVYAIDVQDGMPDLLVMLMPVSEDALHGWSDREDGVQLWVMARAMQAVFEACTDASWHQAQADAGGHEGLLVVEVDVAGAPKAWVTAFESRIKAAFTNPPELVGARIAVVPTRLDMDYLSPPAGEEAEDAG